MSSSSHVRWEREEDLPCLSITYQRVWYAWEEAAKEWHISSGDEAHDVQEEGETANQRTVIGMEGIQQFGVEGIAWLGIIWRF